MPTLVSKRVAAAAGVVGSLTKKDRQILATAIDLATEKDAFSIQISGVKHGVKALIYFKQPVRANAQVAEEDGDDLEDDEGDAAGTGDDAADAAAKAAEAAKRTARFTVQKPAKAEAAKAAKAAKAAATSRADNSGETGPRMKSYFACQLSASSSHGEAPWILCYLGGGGVVSRAWQSTGMDDDTLHDDP